MNQVRVKLVVLGHLKRAIDFDRIVHWQSDVFAIDPHYERYGLLPDTERLDWSYSDAQLAKLVPSRQGSDLAIALTDLALEGNFYSRRLEDNRVVVTFFETSDILGLRDIPLENFILREVYEFVIAYRKFGGRIPDMNYAITHDETRGCLFDMNGIKEDLVFSTESIALCEACKTELIQVGVSLEFIGSVSKELRRIKKGTYYRIAGFVKRRPILTIAISLLAAFLVNLLSSLFYEGCLAHWLGLK